MFFAATKVPLFDSDGKVAGVISTNEDIAQIKQAQVRLAEQLRLTETLIDAR